MISPLAYIHPEAKIGENVEIAPFVFIDKNVVIGDNNKIMANANILYGSRIGNGIDPSKERSASKSCGKTLGINLPPIFQISEL